MDLHNYIDSLKNLLLLGDDDIISSTSNEKQTEFEIFLPQKTFIEISNSDSVLGGKLREIMMSMSKYQDSNMQISIKARRSIIDYEKLYQQLKLIQLEKFEDYNIENILGVWKLIISTNKIIDVTKINEILQQMYKSGDPKIKLEINQSSSETEFNSKLYSALYVSPNTNSPSIEIIRKSMKLIDMISKWSFIDLDLFNDREYGQLFEKHKLDEYDIIEYNRELLQLHEMADELYQNMNIILSNIRHSGNINRQTDICKLLNTKFNSLIISSSGIEFTREYRAILSSYYNILTTYNEFRDKYDNVIKFVENKYNEQVSEFITKLNNEITKEIKTQNVNVVKYESDIKPLNKENFELKMEIISKLETTNITERQKNIILRNLETDPSLIQQDISYLTEEQFNNLRQKTIEFNAYLLHIINILNNKTEVDGSLFENQFTDANRIKCQDDGIDLFNTISKPESNSISNFITSGIKIEDNETHNALKQILQIGEQEYIISLLNSIRELYNDLLKRHADNNYIKSALMLQRIEQALTLDFDNLDIELLDIFHLNDRKLHISRYILLDYIKKLNLACYDIRYMMEGVDSNRQDIIVDCLLTRNTIEYIKKDDQSETPNS